MRTVLLIEDSRFLRIANERLLTRAGYRVISAEDGEAALRKVYVDLERPDIILLDMMLPKMDGPDVLRALKRDPATARIPVVVLTSLSQKNEAKLLREGAAAFLEKSLLLENPQPLLNAIEQLTRRDPRTA
jgi:CheY-like chemotaxis protein